MDPADAFSGASATSIFKWDPRPPLMPPPPQLLAVDQPRDLAEVFQGYGVRRLTVARMGELGFTASTLAGMRDEEVDDVMSTMSHLFRWDLLVGERYGIKAAVRAERQRRLLQESSSSNVYAAAVAAAADHDGQRRRFLLMSSTADHPISQEGLSEERVHLHEGGGEVAERTKRGSTSSRARKANPRGRSKRKPRKKSRSASEEDRGSDSESGTEGSGVGGYGGGERQREHPFIVTVPGEVARAKKNGLDYLFHLYEQCREFLMQVQAVARERGEKCPTKVTNQVFRYAKKVGASYINKPKMRHYVHCYALHCLDEEASNALRKDYKDRGENVGMWRQACYQPLVAISARHAWDIDAVFNSHPRLSIWYVPTKLRQLCHLARSNAAAVDGSSVIPPMF